MIGLCPIRCERCGNRFYRFKNRISSVVVSLGILTFLVAGVFAGFAYWNKHHPPIHSAVPEKEPEKPSAPSASDLQP